MNKNITKIKRKTLFIITLAFSACLNVSAQIIPGEVQTTLESVRDAFTGDLARIIVGICFAGSCIAYAYNKDNEKMKAKVIAVMIASGLLALSQSIVDQAISIAG